MAVMTVLEAHVAPEAESDLVSEYTRATRPLPAYVLQTFLVHADDSDVWQIVTVWRSQEDLARYRETVETPEGVRIFRSVGAEPDLRRFNVAVHSHAHVTDPAVL